MREVVLAELEADLGSVDLRSCTADELACLTDRALAAQRVVAGWVNRLAGEARRREAAGSGSPAEEVMRGGGAVSVENAKRLDRRAGVGETLPGLGAGVDRGEVRSENADALADHLARLNEPERAALARFEPEIARQAACLPPETFSRWVGRLVRKITEPDSGCDPGQSEAERQRAASALWLKRQADGMWRLSGLVDDERGAVLQDVIRRAARRLDTKSEATANARVDALFRLATRAPADSCDSIDGFDPRVGMGVGYIVDAATLAGGPHDASVAQTWGGHDLDPAEVGRLACDTDCYGILYDRLGSPTKVGRTRRAATREQRLQLRGLYDRCPIDGTPFGDCEIHHVRLAWEDGGETELDNLVPISRAWHRRIHDKGWRLTMHADRSLEIWRPDGHLHRAIPPPRPISRE